MTTTRFELDDHLVLAMEALPGNLRVWPHEAAMMANDEVLGEIGERLLDIRSDTEAANVVELRSLARRLKKVARVIELSNAGWDSPLAWKEVAKLHCKRPDLREPGCQCSTCQQAAPDVGSPHGT